MRQGCRWTARITDGAPLTAVLLLLFGLIGSPGVRGQSTEILPKPAGAARVLLIAGRGEALAQALTAGGRAQRVEVAGAEGATLEGLRKDGAVMQAIRAGRWDFVVLSGHPTFGKTFLIEGDSRVGDASAFLHHGRLLVEEVRRAGGRAVLLVPPRRPGAPSMDQQAIDWSYMRLGRDAGAILAPVGDAFARVQRRRPDLALFDAHGNRWSPAGADLAAAVLETALTGRPPVASASPADETTVGGSTETRQLLNDEAWAAVRELAATGGHREVAPPPFPPVPTVPRGEAVSLADLQGTWRGPLRLYPWPATLELEVARDAEGVSVIGRIRFDGAQPPLAFEASEIRFEHRTLSFRNPSDLANGRTVYRIVSRGERLAGVAELTIGEGEAYAIGSLELERVQARPAATSP